MAKWVPSSLRACGESEQALIFCSFVPFFFFRFDKGGQFGVGCRWQCTISAICQRHGQLPNANATESNDKFVTSANIHTADHDTGRRARRCSTNSSNSGAKSESNTGGTEIPKHSNATSDPRIPTAHRAHRVGATRWRNANESRSTWRCYSISGNTTARFAIICPGATPIAATTQLTNRHGKRSKQRQHDEQRWKSKSVSVWLSVDALNHKIWY